MKAPAFSYARPKHLADVTALLTQHGDEARLLAGGQTLLATLNMRLSEPSLLIDLQSIAALKGISLHGTTLRIAAMVTHSEIESSALVAQHAPLLRMAAPHIAHRAIRNLGTFGGSIAYADPAAEWPACLLALDGVVVVLGVRGERRIEASQFFTGLYTTALAANEMIVACEFPIAMVQQKFHFDELARRHGDYAVVGLALVTHLKAGAMQNTRLAWLGVGSLPARSPGVEQVLDGQAPSLQVITLAQQALRAELKVEPDLTHSAAAKLHLASVMLKRALMPWVAAHAAPAAPATPAAV